MQRKSKWHFSIKVREMKFIKLLQQYFKKDASEYMKGSVDPYEFHKSFYFFLKMFRLIEGPLPKWTMFPPLYVGFCGSIATVLCFLAVTNRTKSFEIPVLTESVTYLIVMFYKLVILLTTKFNKEHYYNLMNAMKEDFENIDGKDSRYRAKFFDNQVFTRKAGILTAIFIGIIAYSMILFATLALIYYLATHKPGERPARPLPFPFFLYSIDLGKSPVYEVLLLFSYLCILSQCYSYTFMMQTQVVWVRQITSKADVIIWSIQDVFEGIYPTQNEEEKKHFAKVIKSRMRNIIMMHQSMYRLLDDYSGVYKKLLMFEQTFCSPLVCLTAYGFTTKLDQGEFHGILLLLCVAVIVLISIPNYLCTFLAEKLTSIGDACWETSFWNAGPVIEPYMVLIMQRSLRPLPIQSAGFESVSLETFSKKLTSAYSAFNMLRQANFG